MSLISPLVYLPLTRTLDQFIGTTDTYAYIYIYIFLSVNVSN